MKFLVICADAWDRRELEVTRLKDQGLDFVYEGPGPDEDLDAFDAQAFVSDVVERYQNQDVVGVAGTRDYPSCILAAAIAESLGLPGPNASALIASQHKYYARQVQARAVPDATPRFAAIVASDKNPDLGTISFPFFIKPVKSKASVLAQVVHDRAELLEYLGDAESQNDAFVGPFNQLLAEYTDIKERANQFIGEEILEGTQVTVECFTSGGQTQIMGIVDSVMYPGTISFARFEYPSKLPQDVQAKMETIAAEAGRAFGFDQMMFNIEMFYNPTSKAVHIIEINSRMSSQFADLFGKVDGTNSYDVQIALSRGETPRFVRGQGQFQVATSFVMRSFEDRWIVRVPEAEEIQRITQTHPDARISPLVSARERLSDHPHQPESYRYAIVNLGGNSPEHLEDRYGEVEAQLPFEFSPPMKRKALRRTKSRAG